MPAKFFPLCDYEIIRDSSPGAQVWSTIGGVFVPYSDATYLSWLSSAASDALSVALLFSILDCSSADAGASTSLHFLDASLLTTGQRFNISGTGLYDGNRAITTVDATHVKIPVAFAGNATGTMATPQIIDTFARWTATLNQAATANWASTAQQASFTYSSNLQLTNPLPRTLILNPTVVGLSVALPPMDMPNSLPLGQTLFISNISFTTGILTYNFSGSAGTNPTIPTQRDALLFNTNNTTLQGTPVLNPIVEPPVFINDVNPGGAVTSVLYLSAYLHGHIAGLTLSAPGGTNILGIDTGVATSDANITAAPMLMALPSAFTKNMGAWVVGSGNGALDTGTAAINTWYHVYLIQRQDTGNSDILFSLQPVAGGGGLPTMPANYTHKRRIGSFATDGAGNILAFIQEGDVFRWANPIINVNATNPGTAAFLAAASAPVGVVTFADLVVDMVNTAGTNTLNAVYISDLALPDLVAGFPVSTVGHMVTPIAGGLVIVHIPASVRTNLSAQYRVRLQASDANTIIAIGTLGWTDRRGAR